MVPANGMMEKKPKIFSTNHKITPNSRETTKKRMMKMMMRAALPPPSKNPKASNVGSTK
jgi:hypothetical protein